MSKKVISALVLLGLAVVVMIMNRDDIGLNLIVFKVNTIESFAILGSTVLGIVIGVLLK